MADRDETDLDNEDNWDFDAAFVHPPSTTAHAVVPVSFERGDFERIAAYARKQGITLSTLIRDAALASVRDDQPGLRSDRPDVDHPEHPE
jgi:hypothetical protein